MPGRIFHIFWQEYWSNITRRGYLLFTFGLPILMMIVPALGGLALGMVVRMVLPEPDLRPVGLVDEANLLREAVELPEGPVDIRRFADLPTATQALDKDQIQAIYHIPPDYWQSGQVILSYETAPTLLVDQMVSRWLRQQVQARVPLDILTRLQQGPAIEQQGTATERNFSEANFIEPLLVFMMIYAVRLAGSFSANYVFESIASESDDRTLEIMLSTVSPVYFIVGKLLGILSVGLTQIGIWGGGILVVVLAGSQLAGFNMLTYLLSWEHLPLVIVVLAATYLMDQILAAGLGLLRVSGGAGNLLFNTFNMVVGVSLIYAIYFVPRNPHTGLAVAASLFPLTAPLVLLIRVVVSQVPGWQIAASLVLLAGANVLGLLWLRRLLRTNLLVSRDSFSVRRYLARLWPSRARG